MNIFQFLILLGIIKIVFDYLEKLLSFLSAILFTLVKFVRGMHLVKILMAYLFVSIIGLATLFALQDIGSGWQFVFFPIIGAVLLFIDFGNNVLFTDFKNTAHKSKEQLSHTYRYSPEVKILRESALIDVVIMYSSVGIFLLILFIPIIATNPLTNWLFMIMRRAHELVNKIPIISWLIGAFLIIGILFQAYKLVKKGYLHQKIKRRFKNNFK